MNDRLKCFYITGVIVTIIIGTLLHFVYEWSGDNPIVGIFGPVNESVWEHLKLFFWPAFFLGILEYYLISKNYSNYIPAKTISFYIGILMTIIIYYSYTGVFGTHYLVLDIFIFIISVIISQYICYKIIRSDINFGSSISLISLIAILLLVITFVIFTFSAPEIPLFRDPNNGSYGIKFVL